MTLAHCRTALLALTAAAVACSPDGTGKPLAPRSPTFSESSTPYRYSYLIVGHASQGLPPTLEADVLAAGGTLSATIPQVGLAVAESERSDFAEIARINGIEEILPDVPVATTNSGRASAEFMAQSLGEPTGTLLAGAPPIPAGGDALSGLQWALQAIHAPEAWALGYSGRGVRVAVLDAGIQSTHTDLAPNLNTALSTSFVPGETFNTPPGAHGTQVSGIIAAARNNLGVVGVAPNAELVMIKVLPAVNPGPVSRIVQGLVYAADIGARIANISIGVNLPRSGIITDDRGTEDRNDDVRVKVSNASSIALIRAMGRATNYAHSKGVLIIAGAGNIEKDFDQSWSDFGIPQELPHVITVAPTGPVGWALDQTTDLDVHPSYSNFGQSYITVAAPGGNFDVRDRPGLPPSCTLLTFTRVCLSFDLVLTTGLGNGLVWNFGGSLAAPHVAGVAALLIESLGPSATPDQAESILRRTADDIGKPGNDDYFGQGRVNALKAVTWR